MRVPMSEEDVKKLIAAIREDEGVEEGSDGSFTLDLYEPEPAVTIEMYPEGDGLEITAAARLEYSEEFGGYYMGERIRDEAELAALSERLAKVYLA